MPPLFATSLRNSPALRASFVDSASFFRSPAGVRGFGRPTARRFFGVFDFRAATPDFLSKLPLLNLTACVLSASILVLNGLYLIRFLFPVRWRTIPDGPALLLCPWNECAVGSFAWFSACALDSVSGSFWVLPAYLVSDFTPQFVSAVFGICCASEFCSSKQADLDFRTLDQFKLLTDGFLLSFGVQFPLPCHGGLRLELVLVFGENRNAQVLFLSFSPKDPVVPPLLMWL